jgi:PTH2 family peptidyl-tRNA hydrolase
MNPAMYIFVNSALGMSAGKMSAQAAHAAVEAYRRSEATHLREWYKGGHYKKLVMDGGDSTQMLSIYHYLQERHFNCALIVDEGRTEETYFVPTAIGVEVVDKDDEHTAATFSSFKTYKEPPQPALGQPTGRLRRVLASAGLSLLEGRGGR